MANVPDEPTQDIENHWTVVGIVPNGAAIFVQPSPHLLAPHLLTTPWKVTETFHLHLYPSTFTPAPSYIGVDPRIGKDDKAPETITWDLSGELIMARGRGLVHWLDKPNEPPLLVVGVETWQRKAIRLAEDIDYLQLVGPPYRDRPADRPFLEKKGKTGRWTLRHIEPLLDPKNPLYHTVSTRFGTM